MFLIARCYGNHEDGIGLYDTSGAIVGSAAPADRNIIAGNGAAAGYTGGINLGLRSSGAKAGSSAWAQMAERATDDAHALGEHAHEWGEAAAGMLDRGRDQAEAVAMRVADRAPAVFEQARYQAGELTGAVADRAPVVADQLRASAQEAARHVRCRRRNWRTAGA